MIFLQNRDQARDPGCLIGFPRKIALAGRFLHAVLRLGGKGGGGHVVPAWACSLPGLVLFAASTILSPRFPARLHTSIGIQLG